MTEIVNFRLKNYSHFYENVLRLIKLFVFNRKELNL